MKALPLILATAALTTAMAPATMSSMEIAEYTGKRHNNVVRDIRKDFAAANIALLKFERSYEDASGKRNLRYDLPKEECLFVIARYDARVRWAIIQRWLELEKQLASPQPIDAESLSRALTERGSLKVAEKLLGLMRIKHAYGSIAPDGRPRIGFRGPHFTVQRCRLGDARMINLADGMFWQPELALGFEPFALSAA